MRSAACEVCFAPKSNRRNGREGVTAGRTVTDALDEVEKLAAEISDDQVDALEKIRQWLVSMKDQPASV